MVQATPLNLLVKSHLALLLCNIIWACDYPFYNLVLSKYVAPIALVTASLCAAALFSLVPLLWSKAKPIARKDIKTMIGAALLIGLEIAGKSIADARVVINGAGAAAVSIARLFLKLGLNCENLVLCDSKGVVSTRREDLNPVKEQLATDREDVDTLADALQGADVFLGVSAPGILTPEMVRTMAHDPLVLALANPTPEITYEEAMASRPDIIFATGRSDYPNQVNNVLAFPYLFRGALDVYASTINDEMKLAVTHALARLAKEPVPQEVLKTYGLKSLSFGREYLIPKPSDPRLLAVVATAVARAAIESGVARREIEDWDAYAASLTRRVKNTK